MGETYPFTGYYDFKVQSETAGKNFPEIDSGRHMYMFSVQVDLKGESKVAVYRRSAASRPCNPG
jgi:hypothetical protein